MIRNFTVIFLTILICGFTDNHSIVGQSHKKKPVNYVNTIIGTAPSKTVSALKHGYGTENNAQVIPSVTVPWGMTNWTPQTRNTEKKCEAPYYYIDSLITGFRGSHWLSGSCTQDYGSVTLMPLPNTNKLLPEERGSHYSHNKEVTTPYRYKTFLEDYNIESEITATTRTGFLKFTFNKADSGVVAIEPNSDENEGFIKIIPERNEIVGYNPVHRIYMGWGNKAGFSGYFVAKFDKEFSSFGIYSKCEVYKNRMEILNKEKSGGYVSFKLSGDKTVYVKVGTSFTSIEEARKNLETETSTLSFDAVKEKLKDGWNKKLSRIEIQKTSDDEKIKFYTALYHSLQQPRIYNDCSGSYPSFAGGDSICNSNNKNYYDDFSVWDTYRALHPLYNLLFPEYSADMVTSLIAKGKQAGWLPIFPCWNSYTSAMIGDHVISIIADAYIKNIVNLTESDYEIIKKNATLSPESVEDYKNGKGRRALKSYLKYGYVPLEDSVNEAHHKQEQVSRTMEYAYDDFALCQIAKKLGKEKDYQYFLARSKNYINVYDSSVQSVRGKFADGTFTNNFVKTERMPYITEGTPWQYTWYVPQDVPGLIRLMGGKEKFNRNLDVFFASGQYWHGNEPGHQIPFLYTYSGQLQKTNENVSKILKEEYSADAGGLSGNDDSGQMSAWYVFAAIGLYPVCPGKDEYAVFSPAFEKIKINLPQNKTLIINAGALNSNKKKVKQIKLNGLEIKDNKVSHSELIKGGVLDFIME
jgi:predicted alpha-1,2-mannosidase